MKSPAIGRVFFLEFIDLLDLGGLDLPVDERRCMVAIELGEEGFRPVVADGFGKVINLC